MNVGRFGARGGRSAWRAAAILATAALAVASCTDNAKSGDNGSARSNDSGLTLTSLSTDSQRVTGGDVLLSIAPGKATKGQSNLDEVEVTVDGEPATTEARTGANDGSVAVLVSGVPNGTHTVTATSGSGSSKQEGTLLVRNHSIAGPVFSGKHAPMPTCTTERFGLGVPADEDCFAPTKVTYKYFTTDRKYDDLADPADVPNDAFSYTVDGVEQPLVIRVETGVINRGIFTISMPEPRHAEATELRPSSSALDRWNKRLIYRFGGGCGTTYSQGFNLFGDPDPEVLAAGYATATSTLNTFQVSCNDVLSAETAMMVKEHFAEAYAPPELTLGEGGSGGAIQQFMIAQNYPGILDAIAPTLPFPDAVSISGGVLDCALLNNFYRSGSGKSWTEEERLAANGHLTTATCDFWEQTFAAGVDASRCGFGQAVAGATAVIPGIGSAGFPEPPLEEIYDPKTNPDGIRCTLQDSNVNIYGTDPATGFAKRPWDNVGVQYGLAGLNDGTLSIDQFLDVNSEIGSHDIDGQLQPGRAAADVSALETSYRTGRVMSGGGDLDSIPIIMVNIYTDPQGDIHDRYRAFTIRDRLAQSDGTQAENLAIWTREIPPGKSLIDSLTGSISLGTSIISALDQWATALRDGTEPPKSAVNTCFSADGAVIESGDDVYEAPGPCTDPYPILGDPRTVAGEDRREDIIKCELISVEDAIAADMFDVTFDSGQLRRLERAFPEGVCDWSQPGVGQVPLGKAWQTFK